jgi:hypothetical protein
MLSRNAAGIGLAAHLPRIEVLGDSPYMVRASFWRKI